MALSRRIRQPHLEHHPAERGTRFVERRTEVVESGTGFRERDPGSR